MQVIFSSIKLMQNQPQTIEICSKQKFGIHLFGGFSYTWFN